MQDTPKFIDLTPLGAQTPEGIIRINTASEAWHNKQIEVANDTLHFLRENYGFLRAALVADKAHEAKAELDDLYEKTQEMVTLQDAFVKAVCGR